MSNELGAAVSAHLEGLAASAPPAKIKYPLACGCAGPNHVSKCKACQAQAIEDDARRMGIPDVVFVIEAPAAEVDFAPLVAEVRAKLRAGKKLTVHLLHRGVA